MKELIKRLSKLIEEDDDSFYPIDEYNFQSRTNKTLLQLAREIHKLKWKKK